MFSRPKIAAVTGLVGSLAVIYVGAAHAYAEGPRGECRTTAEGDIVCVRKSETIRQDKQGKYFIKQIQDCETADRPRMVLPEEGLLTNPFTEVGPKVECTNKADLPKGFKPSLPRGFKAPHFQF
jgi:hypothetical protein